METAPGPGPAPFQSSLQVIDTGSQDDVVPFGERIYGDGPNMLLFMQAQSDILTADIHRPPPSPQSRSPEVSVNEQVNHPDLVSMFTEKKRFLTYNMQQISNKSLRIAFKHDPSRHKKDDGPPITVLIPAGAIPEDHGIRLDGLARRLCSIFENSPAELADHDVKRRRIAVQTAIRHEVPVQRGVVSLNSPLLQEEEKGRLKIFRVKSNVEVFDLDSSSMRNCPLEFRLLDRLVPRSDAPGLVSYFNTQGFQTLPNNSTLSIVSQQFAVNAMFWVQSCLHGRSIHGAQLNRIVEILFAYYVGSPIPADELESEEDRRKLLRDYAKTRYPTSWQWNKIRIRDHFHSIAYAHSSLAADVRHAQLPPIQCPDTSKSRSRVATAFFATCVATGAIEAGWKEATRIADQELRAEANDEELGCLVDDDRAHLTFHACEACRLIKPCWCFHHPASGTICKTCVEHVRFGVRNEASDSEDDLYYSVEDVTATRERVTSFERNLEHLIRDQAAQLAQLAESLNTRLDNMSESLITRLDNMSELLNTRLDNMAESLHTLLDNLSKTVINLDHGSKQTKEDIKAFQKIELDIQLLLQRFESIKTFEVNILSGQREPAPGTSATPPGTSKSPDARPPSPSFRLFTPSETRPRSETPIASNQVRAGSRRRHEQTLDPHTASPTRGGYGNVPRPNKIRFEELESHESEPGKDAARPLFEAGIAPPSSRSDTSPKGRSDTRGEVPSGSLPFRGKRCTDSTRRKRSVDLESEAHGTPQSPAAEGHIGYNPQSPKLGGRTE